ncbi:hypothetical protein HK105_204628 [Polyrhizophydium stewartii]|uniref:SHSP domain-containing protein n=1 Tax=Polyrhizophydium stewartii TaxID=2732419 RepID=A0ABR4N8T2_9FUNG
MFAIHSPVFVVQPHRFFEPEPACDIDMLSALEASLIEDIFGPQRRAACPCHHHAARHPAWQAPHHARSRIVHPALRAASPFAASPFAIGPSDIDRKGKRPMHQAASQPQPQPQPQSVPAPASPSPSAASLRSSADPRIPATPGIEPLLIPAEEYYGGVVPPKPKDENDVDFDDELEDGVESIHVPADESPAELAVEQPQPIEQPAEKPAEQPAEPAVEQPAEPVVEQPQIADSPAEMQAPVPDQPQHEAHADDTASEYSDWSIVNPKPAGETHRAAEQPTEQPAEQPIDKPADQPVDQPAEQPAEAEPQRTRTKSAKPVQITDDEYIYTMELPEGTTKASLSLQVERVRRQLEVKGDSGFERVIKLPTDADLDATRASVDDDAGALRIVFKRRGATKLRRVQIQ